MPRLKRGLCRVTRKQNAPDGGTRLRPCHFHQISQIRTFCHPLKQPNTAKCVSSFFVCFFFIIRSCRNLNHHHCKKILSPAGLQHPPDLLKMPSSIPNFENLGLSAIGSGSSLEPEGGGLADIKRLQGGDRGRQI